MNARVNSPWRHWVAWLMLISHNIALIGLIAGPKFYHKYFHMASEWEPVYKFALVLFLFWYPLVQCHVFISFRKALKIQAGIQERIGLFGAAASLACWLALLFVIFP